MLSFEFIRGAFYTAGAATVWTLAFLQWQDYQVFAAEAKRHLETIDRPKGN